MDIISEVDVFSMNKFIIIIQKQAGAGKSTYTRAERNEKTELGPVAHRGSDEIGAVKRHVADVGNG